jgi:hypothetical protein
MAHDAFKAKLARVEALRSADGEALLSGVRKALADRNNYVVAKAAAIVAERYATDAVPELLAAYDRFFKDAAATDPLVTAKGAIALALKELDYREPGPFLRGIVHVQLEPVWGKLEDHAGPLRVACAHALAACDMDGVQRLALLVDRLADDDAAVRREAVRAVGGLGGHEAVLLLRLKALTGDAAADVLGECFAALLDLEPDAAVAFVERFLEKPASDDVAVEAIAALAASRIPAAFALVRRCYAGAIALDRRRAIVLSCAASPLPEAAEFLLTVLGDEGEALAVEALTALAAGRHRNDIRERAGDIVERRGRKELRAAYAREFRGR